MRTSYGVVWREGDHPLARGKLELLPRAVRLDGMAGSVPTTREIAYDYLTEIRIGRSPEERIDGRPSLVLEPRTGDTLSIASSAMRSRTRSARRSTTPTCSSPVSWAMVKRKPARWRPVGIRTSF